MSDDDVKKSRDTRDKIDNDTLTKDNKNTPKKKVTEEDKLRILIDSYLTEMDDLANDLMWFQEELFKSLNKDVERMDKISNNIITKLTAWHFEDREASNSNLPKYGDITQPGWSIEPLDMYHQDDSRPGKEIKMTNVDGREVVYYGDTKAIVTDPRYYGTKNYVVVIAAPKNPKDINGWLKRIDSMVGHAIFDVAPYLIGGSVRGEG